MPPTPPPSLAAAMHQIIETIALITEAAVGYRKTLIDKGITADAADRMAADFHHYVVAMMTKAVNP